MNLPDDNDANLGYTTAQAVADNSALATREVTALPAGEATGATLSEYPAPQYWWAYAWPPAVWLFDHQPIINAILFGNYRRLTDQALTLLLEGRPGRTLQIASVYGVLVPELARRFTPEQPLHLIDISPIQLRRAQAKIEAVGAAESVRLSRMDAQALHFETSSFESALIFLLLHEMPDAARRRTLRQALRVLAPGGRLVLAEYGARTQHHPLHRWPIRWLFGAAEPYLPSLWRTDLPALVVECGASVGKQVVLDSETTFFRGFYRVLRFRLLDG